MDILLDTNILIDYFAQRKPYAEQVQQLKTMAFFGDARLWATSNSFTDTFYIISKTHGPKLVQQAFLASKDYLKICSVNGADIYEASERSWADFEDCLITVCAEKLQADYILTRDIAGFKLSSIPALTPFVFLEMLRETRGLSYTDIS